MSILGGKALLMVERFRNTLTQQEYFKNAQYLECHNSPPDTTSLINKRVNEFSEALIKNELHAENCDACGGIESVLPCENKSLTYTTTNGPYTIPHLNGINCYLCDRTILDEDSQEIFDAVKLKIKFGAVPPVAEDLTIKTDLPRNRADAYASIIDYQRKLLSGEIAVLENMHLVWELGAAYGTDLRVSDLGHVVTMLSRPHTVGNFTSKAVIEKGEGEVYYHVPTSTFYFYLQDYTPSKIFSKAETLLDLFNVLKKLLPHSLMSVHYE